MIFAPGNAEGGRGAHGSGGFSSRLTMWNSVPIKVILLLVSAIGVIVCLALMDSATDENSVVRAATYAEPSRMELAGRTGGVCFAVYRQAAKVCKNNFEKVHSKLCYKDFVVNDACVQRNHKAHEDRESCIEKAARGQHKCQTLRQRMRNLCSTTFSKQKKVCMKSMKITHDSCHQVSQHTLQSIEKKETAQQTGAAIAATKEPLEVRENRILELRRVEAKKHRECRRTAYVSTNSCRATAHTKVVACMRQWQPLTPTRVLRKVVTGVDTTSD